MIGCMGEDVMCLEVLTSIMFKFRSLLGLGLQEMSMIVNITIPGIIKFGTRLE